MKSKYINRLIILFSLCVVCSGCTPREQPAPAVETPPAVVGISAPVPPGVVRYCWEEPMVKFERNGPGLDSEGKWYHPSYIAFREVRMGKWRPCSPVRSEAQGGRNSGNEQ